MSTAKFKGSVTNQSLFSFWPTEISIDKGNLATMPDGVTPGVLIHVSARANFNDGYGGYCERVTTHLLPLAALEATISGQDFYGNATYNLTALNSIFANFGWQASEQL